MSITPTTLSLKSQSFNHNENIPSKYTCEGDNISPALEIGNIPEGTESLALIVEDPDAPKKTFTHWLVWNIEPGTAIEENTSPGISGMNGFSKTGYGGPCPPQGTHRYVFTAYALNRKLDLQAGSDKKALREAMSGHILGEGELIGLYEKQQNDDDDDI